MQSAMETALDARAMVIHMGNIERNSVSQSMRMDELIDAVNRMTQAVTSNQVLPDNVDLTQNFSDAFQFEPELVTEAVIISDSHFAQTPVRKQGEVKQAGPLSGADNQSENRHGKTENEKRKPKSQKSSTKVLLPEGTSPKVEAFVNWAVSKGYSDWSSVTIQDMWDGANGDGVKIGRTLVANALKALRDGTYDEYVKSVK